MKRIVAYNRDGDVVAKYRTLAIAAAEFKTTAHYIKKALLNNQIMKGVRLMYEEDYEKAIADRGNVGWHKIHAKKKPTKAETLQKASNAAYRSINILNNYREWAKTFLKWLSELGERYKQRADYPLYPTIIGDFYPDQKDKEIALFSSLLMSENENLYSQITDMRSILTDKPSVWFKERGFEVLSLGEMQNKCLHGNAFCRYWKIAKLYDRLWHIMYRENGKPTGWNFCDFFINQSKECLHENIRSYLNGQGGAADELEITDYKARLLAFVMCKSDGIGAGLWDVSKRTIKVPLLDGMKGFMRFIFPDYLRCGNIDDAIRNLAFYGDFLYIFLGWQELCDLYPRETKRFIKMYSGWTNENNYKHLRASKWAVRFPPML